MVILNNPRARWSNLQIIWLATWLASAIVSLFLYSNNSSEAFNSKGMCNITGIGENLYALAAPRYWFGIITVVLTVGGIVWVWRHFSERWPFIAQYRTVSLVIVGLVATFFFRQGC